MTILARLALGVLAEPMGKFEATYTAELAPLLEQHGLQPATKQGRPIRSGIFSRLFAMESVAEFEAQRQALQGDETWQRTISSRLQIKDSIFEQGCRFELYQTPAGSGTRSLLGAGMRQGIWRSFGIQDGLPDAAIWDLLQDHHDDLWLATSKGAVRYDGREISVFTTADGLVDESVLCLWQDRKRQLWFGTKSGLSCYNQATFTTFGVADGLVHDKVECIFEDRHNQLWFGGPGGVSCYDGRRFKSYGAADGLAGNGVTAIAEDASGHLWFGTYSGLVSCFDGESFSAPVDDETPRQQFVRSILADRQGRLWVGNNSGAICYNGRRRQSFSAADGLAPGSVNSIVQDRQGQLWFGTSLGGTSRYDGQRFYTYTTEDGLENDQVNSILEDRSGRLWFGTWSGVSSYDQGQFALFTSADGLAGNGVMAAAEDRAGHLWFGTWNGVSRYDDGEFTTVSEMNVRAILEDRAGHLWFGGVGGARCYDGVNWQHFGAEEGLATDDVLAITEDRSGRLWFGGGFGLSCYDGESFTNFGVDEGLLPGYVKDIVEDHRGDIWCNMGSFGSDTYPLGLVRYDGKKFTLVTTDDGLAHNRVSAIYRDRSDQLWFGTAAGISCVARPSLDGRQFTSFNTADGLAPGEVIAISEDRQGRLWFATFGSGACCYDGRVFQRITRKDGLIHNVVQQVLQDSAGFLWFATEGGLTRYRPQRDPPKIHIADVIADQRYGAVHQVEVPAARGLVAFEFSGCSWTTPPEGMAYIYRLQGWSDAWTTTRDQRVEYRNLPPNTYTFQIQAVDRDLNYSQLVQVEVRSVPDPRLEALSKALSGGDDQFVGHSPALLQAQAQLAQVAPTEETVLILGATGTGKGLAARMLHRASARSSGPLITVDCGTLPKELVESELFGHERGAFTGAVSRKLGKVELAEGGTLFLDEIGDLPLEAQVKLLRLLQEYQYERVGGTQTRRAQVRILVATNRDLRQMVAENLFREDLYYRLRVFEVVLPLLRQRQEDILLLAVYFAERMAAHLDKPVQSFTRQAEQALLEYKWPGNVRELEHTIRRAVVVCPGREIRVEDLALESFLEAPPASAALVSLAEHERRYIEQVLEQTGGVIRGERGAAAILGLKPTTLYSRMKKLGIERPPRRNID